MNVITFMRRFEAPILAGAKQLTIRAPRRDGRPRAVAGEAASLRVWRGRPYWSQQREFAQVVVDFVFPVRVSERGVHRRDMPRKRARLDKEFIARADGFASWAEMLAFHRGNHPLPFDGELVKWKDLVPTSDARAVDVLIEQQMELMR